MYGHKDTQYDTFRKREYQSMIVPKIDIKDMSKLNPKTLLEIRNTRCQQDGKIVLTPHQEFIKVFLQPDVSVRGVLMFWKTGVGKTCGSIQVAENFRPFVNKYGTRIMILAPSKIIKNFRSTILGSCLNVNGPLSESERQEILYKSYNLMSHKKFVQRVLGEKIRDENGKAIKVKGKIQYRTLGEQIKYLKNTLLIVDEAHNMLGADTSNRFALEKILKDTRSKNLKILLLTATPMKNTAEEIIPLLNFLKNYNEKIYMKDIFYSNPLRFAPNGEQKLRDAAQGVVSFVRGGDPYTYAKQIDIGSIYSQFKFTPVILCPMSKFQQECYENSTTKNFEQETRNACLIVFPNISDDGKKIIGSTGIKSMHNIIRKINEQNFLSKLKKHFNKLTVGSNFIIKAPYQQNILGGDFLRRDNLPTFSSKFARVLDEIDANVERKKGAGKVFVSTISVQIEALIFEQVLLANGYMSYQNKSTNVANIKCYRCGMMKYKHNDAKLGHEYKPAKYIVVTGSMLSEDNDDNFEEMITAFNDQNNIYGENIKILIGSKVMQEGINLKNISEVHILQGHWQLTNEEQIIGRAIRHCSHIDLMREGYVMPEVKVYRYVSTFGYTNKKKNKTIEERIYQEAEKKLILVKKVEQILIESAIDCPILYHANVNQNEVRRYKNCNKPGKIKCIPKYNFTDGNIKCNDKKLNVYFKGSTNGYSPPSKKDIIYNSYDPRLKQFEVQICLEHIKNFYRTEQWATLDELYTYVYNHYPAYKQKNFDKSFVYKAITMCCPKTDNDFNKYNINLLNQYDEPCYLIHRSGFYILQPSKLHTTASLQERSNTIPKFDRIISLNTVLEKDGYKLKNAKKRLFKYEERYYEKKTPFRVYGIMGQNMKDREPVFKICDTQRSDKSRGEACKTYARKKLEDIAKNILKLDFDSKIPKLTLCNMIKNELYKREQKSKDTSILYFKVPYNYKYVFPIKEVERKPYLLKYLNKYKDNITFTVKQDTIVIEPRYSNNDINKKIIEFTNAVRNADNNTYTIKL